MIRGPVRAHGACVRPCTVRAMQESRTVGPDRATQAMSDIGYGCDVSHMLDRCGSKATTRSSVGGGSPLPSRLLLMRCTGLLATVSN